MIAHLELLTIKAISYSWVRVRAFHKFIVKQVEQHRLDWQDLKAIQDQAKTFFPSFRSKKFATTKGVSSSKFCQRIWKP